MRINKELEGNARNYATSCDEARECSACKKDIGIEETIKQYTDWVNSPFNGFYDTYEYNPDYVEVMCKGCLEQELEKDKLESIKEENDRIDTFEIDCGKYKVYSKYSISFINNRYIIKGFTQDKNYEEPASRAWFEVELKTEKKVTAVNTFNRLKETKQNEPYPVYTPGDYGKKWMWGKMPNRNGRLVMAYG